MHIDTRPAARLSATDAVDLARRLYGLSTTAAPLAGEYDSNYHLTASDGREFVLKVMHPTRDRGFVDMQCQALRTLAERAPTLTLPRVIPSNDGSMIASIADADGSARLVWLLSYVPGRPMANVRPHGPALLASLGTLLGQLDAALLDFSHPDTVRELKWDLARAGWVRDYVTHVKDSHRRALVERCLARTGMAFLFAPVFHPSMRNVAEVRRELGVRTAFNLLGPLVNPARPTHQIVGIFDRALVGRYAEVLRFIYRQSLSFRLRTVAAIAAAATSNPSAISHFAPRKNRQL
jgi:hypothetical protein